MLVLTLLAGCAARSKTRWVHPTKGQSSSPPDRYDYEKVAGQSSKNVYGYAKPWAIRRGDSPLPTAQARVA
jgi:hypothetical protein